MSWLYDPTLATSCYPPVHKVFAVQCVRSGNHAVNGCDRCEIWLLLKNISLKIFVQDATKTERMACMILANACKMTLVKFYETTTAAGRADEAGSVTASRPADGCTWLGASTSASFETPFAGLHSLTAGAFQRNFAPGCSGGSSLSPGLLCKFSLALPPGTA